MTRDSALGDTAAADDLFDPERYARMCELFAEASELTAAERAAFLDQACGDDPPLREHLERSLCELEQPSPFLAVETREAADDPAAHAASRVLPEQIGDYRILRPLGSDHAADLFLAEQEHPRQQLALKVFAADNVAPALLQRFLREAESLRSLSHPGLVEVHAAGVLRVKAGSYAFMAMELSTGRTLPKALEGLRTRDAAERIDQVLRWLSLTARALAAAHQAGVLHGNITPENILITPDEQPLLVNFDAARAFDAERTTIGGDQNIAPATVLYMAPEQVSADGVEWDQRSDVWSLGAVLYQSVTGEPPFACASFGNRSQSLASLVQAITSLDPCERLRKSGRLPPALPAVLEKALEKDPERRYDSATALADDLQAVLAGRPTAARRRSGIERLLRRAQLRLWTVRRSRPKRPPRS